MIFDLYVIRQQIRNSLASDVVNAPKSYHITPVRRSLHWCKITEHIEYKLLSLTYKVLTTTKPPYLHPLITVQPPHNNTRPSSRVTVARPSTSSSLRRWVISWLLFSICFTMSLEPASSFTPSTSFYLWLFSFSFYFRHCHYICSMSSVIIHNSFSLSLSA